MDCEKGCYSDNYRLGYSGKSKEIKKSDILDENEFTKLAKQAEKAKNALQELKITIDTFNKKSKH